MITAKSVIAAALACCLARPACAITPEQQNVQDVYMLSMMAEHFCPDLKLAGDRADKYIAACIVLGSISYPDWHAALQKTESDLFPTVWEMHRQDPAKFCEAAWNRYGPDGFKMLQKK